MLKNFFFLPSKNLVWTIPVILIAGFLTGLFVDTLALKVYIPLFTFLMIFPTMIGFKMKEAVDLSHMKVLIASLLLNFIFIPIVAYGFGTALLSDNPGLFAGIVMISLFPTSGMTISWTMLSKGNVAAAIKITAVSLLLGSFLAPIYLYGMVGTIVKVDVLQTFLTIVQVVLLPMFLAALTHKLIMKKYSLEEFNKKIKPVLPASSTWAMMFIIFTSISMKAKMLVSNPGTLLNAILLLLLFYLVNFTVSTFVARYFFDQANGYALVFGTVLRNLTIALGLAIAFFGPDTSLIITLAFILQVQGAAWYGKLSKQYGWLNRTGSTSAVEQGGQS